MFGVSAEMSSVRLGHVEVVGHVEFWAVNYGLLSERKSVSSRGLACPSQSTQPL